MKEFSKLWKILNILRKKCPWDRKQNLESIMSNLLEETYEIIEAIEKKDYNLLKEELGDMFLQLMFIALIAEEENKFTIKEALNEISEKLKRRHPHIFKGVKVKGTEEVLMNWEKIKMQEKGGRKPLEDIPLTLPSLLYCRKMQSRMKRLNLSWEDSIENYTRKKNKLKRNLNSNLKEKSAELLFLLVDILREKKIDPEINFKEYLKKLKKKLSKKWNKNSFL